jgi:putative toxin-antitoxin system antitoxin component (TIGR02293 family)
MCKRTIIDVHMHFNPGSFRMTAPAAAAVQHLPARPAASLVEWTSVINGLAARAGSVRKGSGTARRAAAEPTGSRSLLLTSVEPVAGANPHRTPGSEALGCRMAPEVAEQLVTGGLDPDFLSGIAGFSGLDSRDVLDFAGIDRTTVSRRKASGSALPQDAAVKALQITDLLTQATEVFGSPTQASTWLTRSHPSLDGETPLRRARTPWGMSKVQSMLVALRYGAAA